ncbi:MAG: DUF5320 domain-containing protein [Thermoproteota archaeon]
MRYRHRNLFYITGLPGCVRFGFSPGWLRLAPEGMPPEPTPFRISFPQAYYREQERTMLEQQIKILESQLEAVRKRLEELSGKGSQQVGGE